MDSDYSIRLKMVENLGGDVTKKYDSVYSIDLEILRLMENGGGGGGGGASSKTVFIDRIWYDRTDEYQAEIKKALEDIYNEVTNKRSVTVIYNGNGYYTQTAPFESSNIVILGVYDVVVIVVGFFKDITYIHLVYNEELNNYQCSIGGDKFATKEELNLPYIYKDGWMNLEANYGNVSEFISEPTVDNEEFFVIKTTVKAYTGTESPNNQIYRAIRDDYNYEHYLSKFAGMKLNQNEYDANYDLIPDGEWYVYFGDIQAATYVRIIVTKAVRNVDGTLDVYLGFKGIDLNSLGFYDCTVDNRDMQGEPGIWSDKNWVKVSDAERISVDSFIGRRTRYFCVNTEGTKVDRIVLFKRMK